MTWWVFPDSISAIAAQAQAFAAMPQDTLFGGAPSPVQYTLRWDNVLSLTNGTFAFTLKPGMATPAQGVVIADISALIPVTSSLTAN